MKTFLPPSSAWRRCSQSGFSLIELISVIGVVAVMATIAVVAAGQITNVAHGEKLRSDVSSINSAIEIYLSNGGSLDGITAPDAVLTKLKTTRSGADGKRHTGGPSGRMIDPRIVAVAFSDSSSRPRALYNATDKRFSIVGSGAGVVFNIDPSLGEMAIPVEARDHGVVAYAETSSWVWDYSAINNPGTTPGTTSVPVSSAPADTLPPSGSGSGGLGGGGGGGGGTPPPPPPPTIPSLPTPVFTPPGGSYPYDTFPFPVTIGGGPDAAVGKLIYKVGSGPWQDYSGQTITAEIGLEVWARAVSFDQDVFVDSAVAYARYRVPTPPRLPTPRFSVWGGAYPGSSFPLSVSLTNLPDPAIGTPFYRIDSGAWTPYTGPVAVPMNTRLRAYYRPVNIYTYRNSYQRSGYYYPVATDLAGTTTTVFKNPAGGPTLVYEINPEGTYFSHGDPTLDLGGEIIDAGEPNTLRFEAAPFTGIGAGDTFKLGDLYYHNGTTFNDSHANSVQMQVSIALVEPAETIAFNLDFDLINTENSDDINASADYARLTNLTQDVNLTIDGVNYQLNLSFGGTDSYGYSTSNEFHVYEGATGRGSLNATFIAKP